MEEADTVDGGSNYVGKLDVSLKSTMLSIFMLTGATKSCPSLAIISLVEICNASPEVQLYASFL